MKLLIVDDEIQIRQGIKEGIDWKSLGFDEVFDAENGIEALDIFRSFQPEIIITDIRMPGMDGLELSKNIRALSKTAKIIILSGYSDFDYAKSALRIGVNEYELKPIKIKSLIQMVTLLKERAEKETADEQLNRMAREYQLMDRIMLGEISDSREVKRIFREYYRVHLEKSIICIAVEADRGKFEAHAHLDDAFHATLLQKLRDMSNSLEGVLIEKSSRLIYLFVSYKNNATLNTKIQDYFTRMNRSLNEVYQRSISMGVSLSGDVEHIPLVIEQADKALENKFIYGNAGLYFYEKSAGEDEGQYHFAGTEKELLAYIQQFHAEGAKMIIHDEFERLVKSKGLSVLRIKMICLEFIHILIRGLGERSIKLELGIEEEALNQLEWLEDCRAWVIGIYERVLNDLSESNSTKHNSNIVKAMNYIKKHFQDELSIEVVATYIGVTPNYFSHLFKKETGIPFNEYLNKTRINEAKRLLKQSNLAAYEITAMVGFLNYKYFVQVFKKHEGCSPTEYRRSK